MAKTKPAAPPHVNSDPLGFFFVGGGGGPASRGPLSLHFVSHQMLVRHAPPVTVAAAARLSDHGNRFGFTPTSCRGATCSVLYLLAPPPLTRRRRKGRPKSPSPRR